jgi:hypothetical protein
MSSVKPVRGIDVIVEKNPGNTAVRTVVTDGEGHFAIPVLPAGLYSLRLSLPKESRTTTNSTDAARKGDIGMNAISNMKAREANPSPAEIQTCSITILGAEGGTKTEDWNLETNRIITKGTDNSMRTTPGKTKIDVVSDGKTPLTGALFTFIIKSKSNISSN